MQVIVCYGDSNTYGRDVVTKGRLDRRVRWTGVLQQALGDRFTVIEEGLNGRTTVWDDPVRGGDKRNGSKYLLPCLESHSPLDLLILMLGTNDCKARFAVTAYDIGLSVGTLVEISQWSKCGPEGAAPAILVMSPPPLGRLDEYAETFHGGEEKSRGLAGHYQQIARQLGCHFFDTSTEIQSSRIDGLHFDPADHEKLGKSLAERVITILNRGRTE